MLFKWGFIIIMSAVGVLKCPVYYIKFPPAARLTCCVYAL